MTAEEYLDSNIVNKTDWLHENMGDIAGFMEAYYQYKLKEVGEKTQCINCTDGTYWSKLYSEYRNCSHDGNNL